MFSISMQMYIFDPGGYPITTLRVRKELSFPPLYLHWVVAIEPVSDFSGLDLRVTTLII